MSETHVVSIAQGQLQGRVISSPNGKTFYSFQGIPYAQPPLGPLRFKAPLPPEPWVGLLDATSEGNKSAQFNLFHNAEYQGDENCLYLNVYSPNLHGEPLPVMIFIHGGGFKSGSGNTDYYGPDYLVEKDVIVVTLNYRCGALGFLSLNIPEVPGNAGLKDIAQAIRWVKNNIKKFGGNSDNITVFGESAGGACVSYLVVSPLTKNLISQAIIQSGTALNSFALQKTPLENARTFAKVLNCQLDDPYDILEFLQTCSTQQIVEAHEKLNPCDTIFTKINIFSVVVEKEFPGVEGFITESYLDLLTTGRVADIPIMIGACAIEIGVGEKFDDLQWIIPEELNIKRDSKESLDIVEKLKQIYLRGNELDGLSLLVSDRGLKVDINRFVRYLVQVSKKPVYYYDFDYFGALNLYNKIFPPTLKGVGHTDELGYLFKNDFQNDLKISEKDNKVRERMVRLWTNFAKCGNPTPDTNHYLPITWLPVEKDNMYYLNIGAELNIKTDVDSERMEFWDHLYNKYFRIWEHPKTNTDEVPIKQRTPENVENIEPSPLPEVAKVSNEVLVSDETITAQSSGSNVDAAGEAVEAVASEADNLQTKVIRANDPPEDDLPKNVGVNKFINFFDSLGKK